MVVRGEVSLGRAHVSCQAISFFCCCGNFRSSISPDEGYHYHNAIGSCAGVGVVSTCKRKGNEKGYATNTLKRSCESNLFSFDQGERNKEASQRGVKIIVGGVNQTMD
jgi:hypothetical protein